MYKNNRLLFQLLTIILLVLSGVYVMAPLYQFVCDNNEYWTLVWKFFFDFTFFDKLFRQSDNIILKVSFYINVSDDLPWTCSLDMPFGFCNIGEPLLRTIKIVNDSDNSITAIALVDIMPSEYKGYFNKQQCFCYEPIRLFPWETVYLPIIFNILPDLHNDLHFGLTKSVIVLYSFIRIGW